MADNSAPSDSELQELFRQSTYEHIDEKRSSEEKHGFAGKQNAITGTWEVRVPTRAKNVIYVTILENSASTIFEAVCGNLTPKPGTPVVMQKVRGVWVAHADNAEVSAFSPTLNLGTQPHTHQLGQGNEDFVEALRFQPLLAHVLDGGNSLFITVNEGFYRYLGLDVWFAGGNINLTSYRPVSASTWCWVKVGIDMTTNTLTALAGSAVSVVIPLTPITLQAVDLGADVLPIAGVRLKNAQSAIQDYRVFYDCRPFSTGMNAPSSGGGSGDDGFLLSWSGFSS